MEVRKARSAIHDADARLDDALRELSYARDQLEEGGYHRQTMLAIDMSIASLIRRQNIVKKLARDLTQPG